MDFGVQALNMDRTIEPAETIRLARLVEELGYRSWWASDHVVLPAPRVDASPSEPTEPIIDPLVHLSFVAAATTRLELGTGVVILPQRNPLVLAKQAASLSVLSGGRFALGVGAGYLEPELTALGVPTADRGRRTDEYLDAMHALWHTPEPAFSGKYVEFKAIDAHPRPRGLRVYVGGHSAGAIRRAVTRAHGWFAIGTVAETEANLARLADIAKTVERPAELGPLSVTVAATQPLTPSVVRQYEDLGIEQLVIHPASLPGTIDEALHRHAELIA
ncbi:TIGR03619 family F420-dependent LLM class oxidoreductase [Nocardia huaxiensis]|uniref:TIGR03619 family F420-dependent LLM class oxidoreductase n=1 Tax=Nocardia huaxiensis TaxID=2755382 RepID=A0A7D6V917_9NOCA|nr:TIGR03619 family F420-dependent LLM class oxidoreductase [Nocardia huaxiensis]QLY29191.1 TIGR03619 family F420-dependent LLM class oxidoreductase [Nocardia huaxiensis]